MIVCTSWWVSSGYFHGTQNLIYMVWHGVCVCVLALGVTDGVWFCFLTVIICEMFDLVLVCFLDSFISILTSVCV